MTFIKNFVETLFFLTIVFVIPGTLIGKAIMYAARLARDSEIVGFAFGTGAIALIASFFIVLLFGGKNDH